MADDDSGWAEDIFSPHYTLLMCADPDTRNLYDCATVSTIVGVSALTLVFAVVELMLLIRKTGQFFSYKMSLMYLALVELFVVVLHYSFFDSNTWTYVALFVEMNMFVIVSYFFTVYALRIRGLTRFIRPVVVPVAAFVELAAVIFLVVEIVDIRLLEASGRRPCVDFAWAVFSGVQMLLGVVLVFTGRIITTKNPAARISAGRPQKRRRHFVTMIYVYTASCVIVLVIQVVFAISFRSMDKCQSVITRNKGGQMAFLLTLFLLSVALPTWVILFVFYSLSQRGTQFTAHIRAVMDRDNKTDSLPPEARALLALFGGGSVSSTPRIIKYGSAEQAAAQSRFEVRDRDGHPRPSPSSSDMSSGSPSPGGIGASLLRGEFSPPRSQQASSASPISPPSQFMH